MSELRELINESGPIALVLHEWAMTVAANAKTLEAARRARKVADMAKAHAEKCADYLTALDAAEVPAKLEVCRWRPTREKVDGFMLFIPGCNPDARSTCAPAFPCKCGRKIEVTHE